MIWEKLIPTYSAFARRNLMVDYEVYTSEYETCRRNLSFADSMYGRLP